MFLGFFWRVGGGGVGLLSANQKGGVNKRRRPGDKTSWWEEAAVNETV